MHTHAEKPKANPTAPSTNTASELAPLQKKENNTGLPDALKSGIENLSGYSMDDVKVHYNSAKPAVLQAHAYAQGTDIHLATGQERHLPHEAWHVVQQKQGRVKPTKQLKEKTPINDDTGLENEADMMGQRALSTHISFSGGPRNMNVANNNPVPQRTVAQLRHVGMMGMEAEVIGERLSFTAFVDPDMEDEHALAILSDPLVVLEEYSMGTLSGLVKVTLDNEAKKADEDLVERSYTVEFVQNAVDVLDESTWEPIASAWLQAGALWKSIYEASQEEAPPTLMDTMAAHEGLALDERWEGGQFEPHKGNPLVHTQGEGEQATHSLKWKDISPSIDVKNEDPEVSAQLTAGASLVALERAFLATQKPLAYGRSLGEGDIAKRKQPSQSSPEENRSDMAKEETMAMVKLINSYLFSTRPATGATKRYMKEYMPLMVRNSLDSVYAGMSEDGKILFKKVCANHIIKGTGLLKAAATDPIFNRTSSKEADATSITLEELLLSIIKMKKNELGTALEANPEAAPGDSFAQAELAGLSEIRDDDPGMLEKYHIHSAQEMMVDVKGVIFENRQAKTMKLSEMPALFTMSADALKKVEEVMNRQEEEGNL